ncbi:RNA-directed DNA polymerase [Leptothermofonsia sichuanensis E412]|uniref:RNA-directed DNA polymerase n=1 Tax=Leptothermofonsia sichuanensis TaxID=2917832 RepID=UPI001CA722A4|nr:RNA-directed DNA polymerase [Leptothermofonsia sichuanensis]QZZ21991.1 RNA-directed DNA polymerase [Leptothermofonsia sichuanensis E412]
MKRYGNLWSQITEFDNLWIAARQAQRGKRFCGNVLEFNYFLEMELCQLQAELKNKTYQPGEYRTFEIQDPKPRLISAAPYRDRVVHHALCNIIMPPLERTLIGDTYANRLGYGTHRALKRFTTFARSYRYCLQCDIQKYFPSIDHEILKALIRRKIKCPDTLWLIDTIIDASNEQVPVIEYFPGDDLLTPIQRRRGLPIGNLTSQFFANLYLSPFDHFAKEQLKLRHYLRYVDDFAAFSDNYQELADARPVMEDYLATLRLKMHPIKSQLFETMHGANFVGFRVLPDRIRVRNDNLRRTRRRMKELQRQYAVGKITLKPLVQRLQSWEAHLLHGDTYRLRRKVFDHYSFVRREEEKRGRAVETRVPPQDLGGF